MVTYPLNEILLATLCWGCVCGADDSREGVEAGRNWGFELAARVSAVCANVWHSRRRRLLRKVFPAFSTRRRLREASQLGQASLMLRGRASRGDRDRRQDASAARRRRRTASGAVLHPVSAYAATRGRASAWRSARVDGKSNEITRAIPELRTCSISSGRDRLDRCDGDTKGDRPAHRRQGRRLRARPQKRNRPSLHRGSRRCSFCRRPACAATCARSAETDAGHGRIEERLCRAVEARWLAERHPDWKDLRSIAAVTARRIDKKTGRESLETRYYITSLEPDPKAILAAVRAHWGIENNLHWTMDVTFDEDRCRTRKDASSLNFAVIRHTAYNILKADKTRGSLRRKRLRACIDPTFRSSLFAA